MIKESTRTINRICVIAIAYILLTVISSALGLMVGSIQFRLSEVLCILPIFTPLAVPGLVIGCFISNMMTGGIFIDIVFGTFATFLGAVGTRILRKNRWAALICPVITNTVMIPLILQQGYHVAGRYFELAFMVCIGEFVCAYLLGQMVIDFIKGDFSSLKRK